MGTQVKTLTTDSFQMDYLVFGRGQKTLVILPGLSVQSVMASADAIAQAYRALADDFTIYLFEPRKQLRAPISIQDMARDAEVAIRTLGLNRVDLYGVSLGGMIAQTFALQAPDLVEKLALCSTAAHMTDAHYSVIDGWIKIAQTGDAEKLYLAFAQTIYSDDVFNQYQPLLIDAAKTVTPPELGRFATLAQAAHGFDIADRLANIACPVLVIWSADDKIFGEDVPALFKSKLDARPDVELWQYNGFGHAVYDAAPDLKERLLDWFQQ